MCRFVTELRQRYITRNLIQATKNLAERGVDCSNALTNPDSPESAALVLELAWLEEDNPWEDYYLSNPKIAKLAAVIIITRGCCRLLYDLIHHGELAPLFKEYEVSDRYNPKSLNDKLQLKADITSAENIVTDLVTLEIIERNGLNLKLTEEGENTFVSHNWDIISKNAVLSEWRPTRTKKKG